MTGTRQVSRLLVIKASCVADNFSLRRSARRGRIGIVLSSCLPELTMCQFLSQLIVRLVTLRSKNFSSMRVDYPIRIAETSPFTLENVPFGIFSTNPDQLAKRAGAAIGDLVIDLQVLEQSNLLKDLLGDEARSIFGSGDLNLFASLPRVIRQQVRLQLIQWLQDQESPLFNDRGLNESVFVPMEEALMHMPMSTSEFTDFMCADVHVNNVNDTCTLHTKQLVLTNPYSVAKSPGQRSLQLTTRYRSAITAGPRLSAFPRNRYVAQGA